MSAAPAAARIRGGVCPAWPAIGPCAATAFGHWRRRTTAGWPEPEIGWSLFAGEHGRGFATEAALRARDYAYRDLGWTTLMSLVHPDNRPSIRVAERLGARFEKPFVIRGTEVGIYRHPAATPAKH